MDTGCSTGDGGSCWMLDIGWKGTGDFETLKFEGRESDLLAPRSLGCHAHHARN
jgi:hypothetical protein